VECLPGAEHKRASAEAAEFGGEIERQLHDFYEERNLAFDDDQATATDGAFVHHAQGFGNGGGIDRGVGINEEDAFTLRSTRAGISGGGDLAMIDVYDVSAEVHRDLGGGVGRCVVDDDDFKGLPCGASAFLDRPERCGEAGFFVVRWDDEGDHC
jgi:hypothetical protein